MGKANDKRETLYEGKFLRLLRIGRWEFAERTNTSGAAALVAVTPDGKLLLVEQYRPPVGASCIELPAGLVGDDAGHEGEGLLSAAGRELSEETGHEADHLEALAQGAPSAGMANELVTLVLATGLRRVSEELGSEHEEIRLHRVPVDEVEAWLKGKAAAGAVIDLKVYAGLYFLLKQRRAG